MTIGELLRKYKHYITIVSFMGTVAATLFVKIDAYAQDKVDAGVSSLRLETTSKLGKLELDVKLVKLKQDQQQKQLDRMEDKQDDVIHLLLEMKRVKDAGK